MKGVMRPILVLPVLAILTLSCRSLSFSTSPTNSPALPTPIRETVVAPVYIPPAVDLVALEDTLVEVYEKANPGVVSLRALGDAEGGLGTGFVIDKEGDIITNYHVIEGIEDLEIAFPSGLKAPIAPLDGRRGPNGCFPASQPSRAVTRPVGYAAPHTGGRLARRCTATGEGAQLMDLGELQRQLAEITLAPYIVRAMRLIDVPRRAASNLFRHQMSTLAILIDYKIIDPIILKASVIHDLFEAADGLPGVTREAIERIDADGPAVYTLVQEVTIQIRDGTKEPKSQYLERVMRTGSDRAKRLKLADRISNLISLGFVNDREFVERYLRETRAHILPYAVAVSGDMYRELSDLTANRERALARWQTL